MTEVLGVVIMKFWAVAGSFCLEIGSCTVSLTIFWFEGGDTCQLCNKKNCRRAVEKLLVGKGPCAKLSFKSFKQVF